MSMPTDKGPTNHEPMVAPIRVGVMVDSLELAAWEYRMLASIAESEYASIELFIVNATEQEPHVSFSQKLASKLPRLPQIARRKFLEQFHQRVVEGKPVLPDPFAKAPHDDLFTKTPVVNVEPIRKKVSDWIQADDIDRIAEYQCDVILRLGFRILRGRILELPRWGVWSLHHGDHHINRGGPAGFWESLEGWPQTGAMLQVLTEDLDNGQVLSRTTSCTNPWSVQENRANYFWKAANLMPRQLKKLHCQGAEMYFAEVAESNRHPQFYANRLFCQPTDGEYARLLTNKFCAKVKHKFIETTQFDQWSLFYDLRNGMSTSFWRFKPLVPPKDRFWADPHVIYRDGKYFVFIEELIHDRGIGHISVLTIDHKGNVSKPVPVLSTDYHLSYPFVFESNGATYMIPETGERRTVELYRCIRFPDQWQHEMNLMEGIHLVDATLHKDDDRWWLFGNVVETPNTSSWDEAFLFSASDFRTTEWSAHPGNPIVSDVSSSRPAGALIEHDGELYRPSQNSSHHYGYGFNLAQVEELSPTRYQERIVCRVTPSWRRDLIATHTINHVGRLTIIDGQLRRWKWSR